MILLLVTIGVLNVGLGFGLAMYYGYGPPGLAGVFEALGPMPPATSAVPSAAGAASALYNPIPALPQTSVAAGESRAEEALLGEVRDMAAAAQGALAAAPARTA